MVPEAVEMPPRGRYLAHEAGWLAGVSGDQIGQWARRGYIRSSQSHGGELPRVYSYQDVAEAMVVHQLRDLNVPLRAIRRTIEYLRDKYGSAWPLTHAELALPREKSEPIVVLRDGEVYFGVSTRHPDEQVMVEEADLVRVARDLHRGGWAVRLAPDIEHIEVDPDRLSGQPTIRGRRVAAADVARLAQTDDGRETLREGYDLSDAEIEDAQRWWRAVQAA